MKKTVLIGVGLVVAVGAVFLSSRKGVQSSQKNTTSEAVGMGQTGNNADASLPLESTTDVKRDEGVASTKEISDPVKSLLLQDGKKHNYQTLLQAIAELDYNLSADDADALMAMLAWPNDRFPEGMRPIEINAVKNDVLEKLLKQQTLPQGIGLQIVDMAQNAGNDPVWRDYCVQFMQPFYDRAAGDLTTKGTKTPNNGESGKSGDSEDELLAIREAMFSALDERDDTLAGTALLGLETLSRTHEEFDRDVIASKAVDIASDEGAYMESRLTALRLASQIGMEHGAKGVEDEASNSKPQTSNSAIADTARVLAQTGETVLMRSAAIVTLGETGRESDRELLESYLMSDNRQIADAAKMALAKMDKRGF